MVQVRQLELQHDYIVQLFQQLTAMYADLKEEMSHIMTHYPVPENEFTLLEEIELVIVSISGYAKQIQASLTVQRIDDAMAQRHSDRSIAHLQTLQVFAIPAIAQFYQTEGDRYPKIKNYLQLLDYLRLLSLEYLQAQKAEDQVPA